LTPALLIEASTKGTAAYDAIETVLKGVEVELSHGVTFQDKDGNERNAIRIQWWNNRATSLGEVVLPASLDIGSAAQEPIPDNVPRYAQSNPPCFIGHYWMSGKPAPLTNNISCLDYSVAKNGKLVAYRWDGEQTLTSEKFTYSGSLS